MLSDQHDCFGGALPVRCRSPRELGDGDVATYLTENLKLLRKVRSKGSARTSPESGFLQSPG